MDSWINVIGLLLALLAGVALPLLVRRRKKGEQSSKAQLYQHLRGLGLQASIVEKGDDRERVGLGRASGQRSEGIIELAESCIDSVNVVSISSQYGTRRFTDYLVKSPNITGARVLRRTKLTARRSPPILGRVVAIEWKGDSSLAQTLNLDYSLQDRLLTAEGKLVTGCIGIFPESKHGIVRMRTNYVLPTTGVFDALCSIARRIRAW